MPRSKKRENTNQEYGHRLRVTRIALGITEAEAAAAHDVTLKTYRRYEEGHQPLGLDGIIKFGDKFDVHLNWLGAGQPDELGSHLTKAAKGKVYILPLITASRRELFELWKHESAR